MEIYNNNGKSNRVFNVKENVIKKNKHLEDIGIEIITEQDKYLFLIDHTSYCCETYGVEIQPENFQMKGKNLVKINWDKGSSPKEEFFTWDCFIMLKLTFEDDTHCFIKIYNQHNGYYPHQYKIMFKGYENIDVL